MISFHSTSFSLLVALVYLFVNNTQLNILERDYKSEVRHAGQELYRQENFYGAEKARG